VLRALIRLWDWFRALFESRKHEMEKKKHEKKKNGRRKRRRRESIYFRGIQ